MLSELEAAIILIVYWVIIALIMIGAVYLYKKMEPPEKKEKEEPKGPKFE